MSSRRWRALLGIIDRDPTDPALADLGKYGMGTERSFGDWQEYSGFNYKAGTLDADWGEWEDRVGIVSHGATNGSLHRGPPDGAAGQGEAGASCNSSASPAHRSRVSPWSSTSPASCRGIKVLRSTSRLVAAAGCGKVCGSEASRSECLATGFDSSSPSTSSRIRGDLDVRVPRRSARARASVRDASEPYAGAHGRLVSLGWASSSRT